MNPDGDKFLTFLQNFKYRNSVEILILSVQELRSVGEYVFSAKSTLIETKIFNIRSLT